MDDIKQIQKDFDVLYISLFKCQKQLNDLEIEYRSLSYSFEEGSSKQSHYKSLIPSIEDLSSKHSALTDQASKFFSNLEFPEMPDFFGVLNRNQAQLLDLINRVSD